MQIIGFLIEIVTKRKLSDPYTYDFQFRLGFNAPFDFDSDANVNQA